MSYEVIVAASFVERAAGTPVPEIVSAGGPARRLRDAAEPIAMHAVWSRTTNERLAELGLDFLGAYVAGRATALGEPAAAVVAATFAWFEPGFVGGVFSAASALVPRDVLVAARTAATTDSLREVLGSEDPCEVADLLVEATAMADATGRPLFAGLRALGRPADPWQRLWWACDLVREHRGDSHTMAAAVAGFRPVEMSILTELWLGMPLLTYAATRGWPHATMEQAVGSLEERGLVSGAALTEEGRTVRDAIEADTDAQEAEIVDALGDRLDEVCERLDEWSAMCIAAHSFPPDILKRAAG